LPPLARDVEALGIELPVTPGAMLLGTMLLETTFVLTIPLADRAL
jgi:hypothetical protein